MNDSRRGFVPLVIIVFLLGMTAVAVQAAIQANLDVLSELSIAEKRAQSSILDTLCIGTAYEHLPGGKAVFKSAAPEKRAALVRAAATFAKAYVRSDAFKQAYAGSRERAKPAPPEAGKSLDDETKARKQAVDEARQNLKNAKTPQEREVFAQALDALEEMDKMMSSKEMQGMMAGAAKAQHDTDQQNYQGELKKWEAEYPKDANVLVARRLKEFLAMSATVDFQAQVVKSDGMLRFVNAAYEQKPDDWKLCYRAGKEAIDAARAVASEWLKELRPAGT